MVLKSSFTKTLCIDLPRLLLWNTLWVIWDVASWAAGIILSQIKLNSQLSSFTSFESTWTGKRGKLQSIGLQRVGHNWLIEQHHQQRIFQFVLIHTVKVFSIVNETELNVFFFFLGGGREGARAMSRAFSMIQCMLATWSLVHLCFLNPAYISGSSQFKYYWSLAWSILSIILILCEMSAIVW